MPGSQRDWQPVFKKEPQGMTGSARIPYQKKLSTSLQKFPQSLLQGSPDLTSDERDSEPLAPLCRRFESLLPLPGFGTQHMDEPAHALNRRIGAFIVEQRPFR